MKLNESDLLEKWLSDTSFVNWAKESDREDVQHWNTYFEQNPEYKELSELGRFSILNLEAKSILVDENRSQAALQRLKVSLKERNSVKTPILKRVPFYRRWQAVAAIFLLIGMGYWGYLKTSDVTNKVLYATTFGETEQIILADDSKVILNANSTLSYDKNQPRKVWLKGEAFFEVVKKPITEENFQVFTNDLTVEVLGTVFNVKNRNDKTKVFLEEGKVVLEMQELKSNKIEMSPGELVSYSIKEQKVLEKRQAKTLLNTSWKDGIIRFEEATLPDALREISTIYGITFEVKDAEINKQLLSGGVPNNNLEIMLESLEKVYGLEIEEVDGKYFIGQK